MYYKIKDKKLKVGTSKNETAAQASVSFFEMATLPRGISLAYNVPANYTRKIVSLLCRCKIPPTLNA
jgi:hypothetical protein